MISFRYHLVSIVGIFIALALGIVIGTTALNGPITTDLRKQVNTLKKDRTNLAQQAKSLQAQVNDANQFATTYGAQLVANVLPKQKVLMIGMPGASTTIEDQIATLIRAGGATVTGRVELTNEYIDQRRTNDIVTLATNQQIGVNLPVTSDAGKLGGALLAYVLLGKGRSTDLAQVLAGFEQLQMLSAPSAPTASTTVVMVGSGAVANNSYAAGVELNFVAAFQKAGGHIVAVGDSGAAKDSGLVAQVRNAGLKSSVSTVDNADTSIGQVSTVLAIADIVKSTVGHYGTGNGAQALFPSPAQ